MWPRSMCSCVGIDEMIQSLLLYFRILILLSRVSRSRCHPAALVRY